MLYLKDVTTLELDEQKCTGCGMCLNVCPHNVFKMDGKAAMIVDRDACMECGACSKNCPAGALQVQSGVGCASAVINGMLGRNGGECCCGPQTDGAGSVKNGPSCCC
jgi:NAD-dependent dihydropyrimidine dehydrogenase PreA subunit